MSQQEYEELQHSVRHWKQIPQLAEETGYDPEMLLIAYTQRVTRAATKRYYKVKARARQLLRRWKGGESFLEISHKEDFPPILTAFHLMMEDKMPRKRFWSYVRDPASAPNKRMTAELEELVREDRIYSPEGNALQHERGRIGEDRLQDWLDDNEVQYQTEEDLRGEGRKTPDVLLRDPLVVDNLEIFWIESKANFGDRVEIKRNLKSQLRPYLELFGPGMVVYWFGYVTDTPLPDGVLIADETFIEQGDLDALVAHPKGEPKPRPRRTPARRPARSTGTKKRASRGKDPSPGKKRTTTSRKRTGKAKSRGKDPASAKPKKKPASKAKSKSKRSSSTTKRKASKSKAKTKTRKRGVSRGKGG